MKVRFDDERLAADAGVLLPAVLASRPHFNRALPATTIAGYTNLRSAAVDRG
jgi:hypothetical protein